MPGPNQQSAAPSCPAACAAQKAQHPAPRSRSDLVHRGEGPVAIHTGSIEDMPAVGHGTGGKGRFGRPEPLPGTRSAWSFSKMARTSSSVVGNEMLEASPDARDSSRPYSSNSSVKGLMVADTRTPPLANYSVCREMLPHRFVDVFETVSIIGDFYVRAIRRAARFPRQRLMLLTHMAPPSPIARLSPEKS